MSDLDADPSLAGLVEAAAQAVQDDHRDKRQRTDDFNHIPSEDMAADTVTADGLPNNDQHNGDELNDAPLDDGPPNGTAGSDGSQSSASHHTDSPNTAVLFREVGENARGSRPPMARMFQTLELVPENFLKMQNDAKSYMLDTNYLDRRDVIGEKRQHGGQDLARIRLFNHTEAYLKAGAGERYFGHHAVTPGYVRTMFWPEDSAEIIRQMMPLLRKMVSNERQRVYAAETRKEKARRAALEREPPMPALDIPATTASTATNATVSPAAIGHMPPSTQIMVNMVRFDERGEFKRLMPRFNIDPDVCTSVAAVVNEVKSKLVEPATTQAHPEMAQINLDASCTIKAWTQEGLVDVETDADWLVALLTAEGTEWMDGEVRVLIVV